jgi:hypothetical protein
MHRRASVFQLASCQRLSGKSSFSQFGVNALLCRRRMHLANRLPTHTSYRFIRRFLGDLEPFCSIFMIAADEKAAWPSSSRAERRNMLSGVD